VRTRAASDGLAGTTAACLAATDDEDEDDDDGADDDGGHLAQLTLIPVSSIHSKERYAVHVLDASNFKRTSAHDVI
jgi:hypothetical protein